MSARSIGDVSADALAAGGHVGPTLSLVDSLESNATPLPHDTDAAVADWLTGARALPDWANPERLRRAQKWADAHLALLVAGLFCASLPSAYAAANGARVVHAAGRMRTDVDRRIHDTGTFVLAVLRPGGFSPSGRALISCARVRLVHAAVRARLADRVPPGEVAINQRDLLGTLLTFSVLLVDALRKMGVHISQHEEADYFHLWRVVGACLGIEPERLPLNAAAARLVGEQIGETELRPSREGRELAEILFERIADHVSFSQARSWPRALSAQLLDDRARDALALRLGPSWLDALPFGGLELRLAGKGAAFVARKIGSPLIETMLIHARRQSVSESRAAARASRPYP